MQQSTPLNKVLKTTKPQITRLKNVGVETLGDFLKYFPRTYSDKSQFRKIVEIRTDDLNTIKGTLSHLVEIRTKFGKKLIKAKLSDETGSCDIVWFNQPFIKNILYNGQKVILSGKAKFELGKITLISPEYETQKKDQLHTSRLVPIYHETEGLHSKWIREKLHPLLGLTKELFPEYLPDQIVAEHDFMSYPQAIAETHFPSTEEKLNLAKSRLAFDELFLIQLQVLQKRWAWRQIANDEKKQMMRKPELDDIINELPFELTNAQAKTLNEILTDMSKEFPMSRLLQGDVGSGKTIVAALAAYNAYLNGYQTAIMAPTEILAEQHFRGLFKIFKDKGITFEFLTNSITASQKLQIYNKLQSGLIDIVIGTHALIQDNVQFNKLGLAIIDEQHRFGVEQRARLKSHGSPHLLSLSATPIPRTMAMTIYGDQDLSIIDELPNGRLPIITRVVPERKRKDAYLWIEDRIKSGRQAFVICPLVDESDTLELKSVMSEYEHLRDNVFPNLRVTYIHGKLKAKEKEAIMSDFKDHEHDILVSTSVIEVGIDIPNSSIIIIEGSERFGLSQLHQFRGRVGRGEHQSYCFLFMQNYSQTAMQRLKAMVDHNSGFKLSEIDLEIRGPGQIYGVRQSGIPDLKMASLSDSKTIEKARNAAEKIINDDAKLHKYPLLQEKVHQLNDIYIKD